MLKTTTLGTRATLGAIGLGGLIAAALAPSAHADAALLAWPASDSVTLPAEV
jgi:hypothetical protein